MNRTFFATALLSLAVVTPAQAKNERISFSHEGVDYTYTVKQVSDNRRVIKGHATPGSSFRLVVAGDRVFGTANGAPVSFRVEEAITLADTETKVASR